ncbi:Probable protein S-acyltransferase 16 (Probable palmitoyltransferase At3g09320) (Zinc finger DHHC domain-containing protein At3g09320) [Durusdinium trenchii]
MGGTVLGSMEEEMDLAFRFALVFGMTLTMVMGGLLGSFLGFHTWLTCQALTTIEFCEKSSTFSRSISYDQGLFENIRAVLGPRVFLWLLPVSPPSGDGLTFFVHGEFKAFPTQDEVHALLSSKPEEDSSAAAPEVTGAKAAAV